MATVDSNAFEIERRGFQWSMNNTLDDGQSSLLYDGNPNNVASGNSAGETKLYSLLPGGTYFQSTGEWWIKTSIPNTWSMLVTDSYLQSELTSTDTVTYSQLTALSAELINEVDTLSAQTKDIYSFLDNEYILVNLSNHCSMPPSQVACFHTSTAKTGKILISANNDYDHFAAEILVTHYSIKSTSDPNVISHGVTNTTYGIIGNNNLITISSSIINDHVNLVITPSAPDIKVELHIQPITPIPRSNMLSLVTPPPTPTPIPGVIC